MKHLTLLSVMLLLIISPPAVFALTPTEIIEKSEQAVQGDTQVAINEITIKTRRWTRTMKMKSFMDRKHAAGFANRKYD